MSLRRSALWLAAALAGCGSQAPRFATSLESSTGPRQPPGVALKRSFASPSTETHDERALVLVPPLDVADARRIVDAFLLAVRTEDLQALDGLLAQGAVQQLSAGREFRNAREYWRHRMTRLDYGALAEDPLYRFQDVRIQRADDAGSLEVSAGLRPKHSGEVLLTLPLLTTHAGSSRLFGPELVFLVTEEEGRLVISRILEDFQLL